jgi:hypothetical protein
MYDVIYVGSDKKNYNFHKKQIPVLKKANNFDHAKEICLTKYFYAIWDDIRVDYNFDYTVDDYSTDYIHIFKNGKHYDGMCLFPRGANPSKQELNYRFFAKKKQLDIQTSMPIIPKYDVVMISYKEPTAEDNWKLLTEKVKAQRVDGVTGIHQAHIAAAKLVSTDMFYIVDGDATIVDEFNFDYQVEAWNKDAVHVFRSKNPINDLVYGYGGVKLFPTQKTINMNVNTADMTTSISNKFKAVDQMSCITSFNSSAYSTWKSAFRECCKLASKVIDRQKDDETNERLEIWCTKNNGAPFGEYALKGARAGRQYGLKHKFQSEAIKKINDFEWLKEQFNANT